MDIDTPTPKGEEELSVFVHPLALIHMSDQYTRIRCGGSPLSPQSAVEGILFGNTTTTTTSSSNNNNNAGAFYVQDAGDIPLEDAATQIELHQAVFAKQSVLGWYKVVDNNNNSSNDATAAATDYEPTAADLKQTQQVQSRYQQKINQSTDDEKEDVNNNDGTLPTFFGVLQVPKQKKKASTKKKDGKLNPAEKQGEEEEEQGDDELPLTLYQLDPSNAGKSLVAMETWSLQTAESERIAVQRVIREKAPAAATETAATAEAAEDAKESKSGAGGKGKHHKNKKQSASAVATEPPVPVEHTVVLPYVDEVAESCQAIANRLTQILQYLEQLSSSSSNNSNVDPQVHLPLLRQVNGLLLQLGPIAATAPSSRGTDGNNKAEASVDQMSSLQQLAQLSQAVEAVTMYAEKFKFVQEHSSSSSSGGRSGRDLRRF